MYDHIYIQISYMNIYVHVTIILIYEHIQIIDMIKEVKKHMINKKHSMGKVYLPREWIGKKVSVELLG